MKEKKIYDVTVVPLAPGHPEACAGGVPEDCLCDECDHMMDCFSDWEKPIPYSKKEEEKAIKD